MKEPAGQRLDMPAGGNLQPSYHLNTSQLYGKVDSPTFHGYWYGGGGGGGVRRGCVNPMYNVFNFDWQILEPSHPLLAVGPP